MPHLTWKIASSVRHANTPILYSLQKISSFHQYVEEYHADIVAILWLTTESIAIQTKESMNMHLVLDQIIQEFGVPDIHFSISEIIA